MEVSSERLNSSTDIGIGSVGTTIEIMELVVTLLTLPTTISLPQKNTD